MDEYHFDHRTFIVYVSSFSLTRKISNNGVPEDAVTNCLKKKEYLVSQNSCLILTSIILSYELRETTLGCSSLPHISRHQDLFAQFSQWSHQCPQRIPPTNLPETKNGQIHPNDNSCGVTLKVPFLMIHMVSANIGSSMVLPLR